MKKSKILRQSFGCKMLYQNKQFSQTHLYLSRAAPSSSCFVNTAGIRRDSHQAMNCWNHDLLIQPYSYSLNMFFFPLYQSSLNPAVLFFCQSLLFQLCPTCPDIFMTLLMSLWSSCFGFGLRLHFVASTFPLPIPVCFD